MTAVHPPPAPRTPVSVTDLHNAQRILLWLRDYVSQPHPELGRKGPVCPFVPQSLRADHLQMVLHDEIDGSDRSAILWLLRHYLQMFVDTTPSNLTERRHRSLLLVLPGLAPENEGSLDGIHHEVKSEMVRNGTMLGQFYRTCPETAIRNPRFLVSSGPVPCFALRHMAPHDVMFLHDRADWFAEYHRRFAHDYAAGKVSDPLMIRLFEQAEKRMEWR